MEKNLSFLDAERRAIAQALEAGEVDRAFSDLALYLERNRLQLSDDTLRLYVEKELFGCFSERGDTFTTLMEQS